MRSRPTMQDPSSGTDSDGWLQSNVRALGSYAHTSTPAYTLSALFVLSTPFGFASPAQAAAEAAAKLQHQQRLARATEAASARGTSGLVARVLANAQSRRAAQQTHAPVRTLPPFWQLAFFAAAFGTGGYMVDQADHLNGSGVVTAWSLTYLLFRTAPTFKQLPRNPLALALSTAVLTLGLGVHGSHYFDKASWSGAVPDLTSAGEELRRAAKGKAQPHGTPTSIFARPPTESHRSNVDGSEMQSRLYEAKHALGRNNDVARTAAYLHRQGDTEPPRSP